VDKFASIYTPAVFAVALAVAVIPPFAFGQPWFEWVYKALVMLVIACPCALVISTPVTVVSGLAAAARRGILVKGGLYLEQGRHLKSVALDKTGTLTHGRPSLTDVVPLRGQPRKKFCGLLRASMRCRSILWPLPSWPATTNRMLRWASSKRSLDEASKATSMEMSITSATTG
jgi:cation transport ATPase